MIATLKSASQYSQSKHYPGFRDAGLKGETDDAYERRTWRQRMHVDANGHVVIPGPQFAGALCEAAKRLMLKRKNNVLWTKSVQAGVMVTEGITLPLKAVDVQGEEQFVPSDGKPGGGKRVPKVFPLIHSWEGQIKVFVFDDEIPKEVIERSLHAAGAIVGIGRFRPQNRGFYGRFIVERVEWNEDDATLAVAP